MNEHRFRPRHGRRTISRLGALLALCLAGAAVAPAPLAAARPGWVQIDVYQDAVTFADHGWVGFGAIADSGSSEVQRIVFGAPQTSLFGLVDSLQTGAIGTFHIQWEGGTTPNRGDFTSPGRVASAWRLYGGTAGYARLVGQGSWTQEIVTDSGDPHLGDLHFRATGFVIARP
jgi:hypothetical protein